MSDAKHDRLRFLFDRALDYTGAKRTEFLERECQDDAALKARVEALLAAAEDERFLAAPTGPKPSSATSPLAEGPGTRIGPYKLLQQIGEGGFGAVFMAEQEKPVARRVALKIIKLGMDTRQVVARFEQERQALALMDHPNVARVYDAGATETGRPYFAMELVKGKPIAEYCDEHQLSIDARLELFQQVCLAVQHAHSKGIIHRDLKPSNILVATHDGKPLAKIIDFGIAKATSSKLTDKTLFTEHQQVIGTLQYMSPEQAEGSLDIDTRTDVYALGVVLYELLTGSTPFDTQTMRDAVYTELARMIREVDPPKPSTRIGQSAETLASIAASRNVEPKRLGTLVRGELDWIVMKALEKDRARRYESAHGLADDVRRYLAGEAVVAAPPSATYRLRKLVARNRGLVLAIGAVVVALLAGAIAFAWQARVAGEERDRAVEARVAEAEQRKAAESERQAAVEARAAEAEQRRIADEQRAEAQRLQQLAEEHATAEAKARNRAEAISSFVTQALKSSDPNAGGDQDVTIVQAMQQAVAALDAGSMRDEPELEANLRKLIAEIVYVNGRITDALPLAERARAMLETLTPDGSRELAFALNQVATIQQDLGHFDVAEPLFRRALAMQRELHSGDHEEVAMAIHNLATLLMYQRRVADAVPLLTESLEMKRRLLPGDHDDIAMTMNNLGSALDQLGRRDEALVNFEQSLAMYDRLYDSNPKLAMALYNLGQTYVPIGRVNEAGELLMRALAMYRELFHGDHPDVARALGGAANVQRVLGRPEVAESLSRESVEMRQRIYPGDHPAVASEMAWLAIVLQDRNDLAGAETSAANALAMQRRLHPTDHPDVARALDGLASVKRSLDRLDEARALAEESLALQKRLNSGDALDVGRAMNKLAAVLSDQKEFARAEELAREALAMLQRVRPGDSSIVASSHASLGLVLLAAGKLEAAEGPFREALAMNQRVYRGDHYDVALSFGHLARCLHALGKTDEERAAFAEAIAMHRRRTPNGTPEFAAVLWRAGDTRVADGDAAGALPLLREAVAFGERMFVATSPSLAKYRASLAACEAALGR